MSESRPTTARPKTSSGRAQSAARGRRPPTAGRNNERPKSPATGTDNANGMVVTGRGVSRAGVPPPSSMGNRVPSRLGTGQGARPITAQRMIPPGSGYIRPITQQGLTGVARAVSRAGTGFGQRQVFDKSYYMGVIRQKINMLKSEIDVLSREVSRGERARQNLIIYEQKAEEEAGKIRELQGKLMDYNMIADRLHTNSDMNQMEIELSELREKNGELNQIVEEALMARKTKEDEVKRLQSAVAEQKKENAALINSIDPEMRDAYEQLKEEAEGLKAQVREKQKDLQEVAAAKAKLDEEVAKSPLKHEAVLLYERLNELITKKNDIEREMKSEGTPEDLRERFVDQIKKINEGIGVIQKQTAEVKASIELAHEELREFQTEMATASNDRSERVRELKSREEHMDKFMETYPDARKGRLEELDNIGTEVIKLLTLIALNKHKVEVIEPVSTIDDEMVNDLLNSSASADELQSVHLSIQEEMASLSTLRYQLKEDIGNLTERRRQLSAQFRSHGDEGGGQRTKLSSQLEAVNRRLRAAEADLPDVEGRLEQLLEEQSHFNDKFSGNEHFPKLRALQAELRTLTNGNADLKKDLNSVEAETNYDALKEEVLRLQREYNAILIAGIMQKTR